MGRRMIYADDAIEAIEEITWYHQNINNEMVSGANSSEHQAWYKAEDVYKALESLPSAQRKGKWIYGMDLPNFCEECGADMRELVNGSQGGKIMIEHKREDWRTCDNCVHRSVCEFRVKGDFEGCEHHIYNADPETYGDLQELIDPVCKWIRTHYPSDGKLIVDKYSAALEIPVHSVYSFEYPKHSKEDDAG